MTEEKCHCVIHPREWPFIDFWKVEWCGYCGHPMSEHFSGVCWHANSMLKWQQENAKR